MFLPFVSTTLQKRRYSKRGGGNFTRIGVEGHGEGGGEGEADSSSHGSSSPDTAIPISGDGSRSASLYGDGGGKSTVIPSGEPFSGRSEGGGTRSDVFGTRTYGSGYPGITGRGVSGRGFPFYFWPIAWGNASCNAGYIADDEYGSPSNSSRPGGPMAEIIFVSDAGNSSFHILADNATVTSLIAVINTNCSAHLSASSTHPLPYDDTDPNSPKPEQAVQYYRASSVVLTLDGYNDTAALSDDSSLPDTPLPTDVDTVLLDCLNQTTGFAVPLIDGSTHHGIPISEWMPFAVCGSVLFLIVYCALRPTKKLRSF